MNLFGLFCVALSLLITAEATLMENSPFDNPVQAEEESIDDYPSEPLASDEEEYDQNEDKEIVDEDPMAEIDEEETFQLEPPDFVGAENATMELTPGGCKESYVASLRAALKRCYTKPPASCQEVRNSNPNSKSGYYILTINGRKHRQYCLFGTLCGVNAGWARIAYLDMRSSPTCPSYLHLIKVNGKRICARRPSTTGTCTSTYFKSYNMKYVQVCGRVFGYKYHTTDAIGRYPYNKPLSIDHPYVDGVSITYGRPRQHIFTLMAGGVESGTSIYNCPCNIGAKRPNFPSYVGSDWYCEASPTQSQKWHTDDLLWDRRLCRSREGNCCKNSYQPYFKKSLRAATTSYLEMRLCGDESTANENVGVSNYAIYVR